MVDKLRRSVEDLEAPECENCKVAMKWHSSQLLRTTGKILHRFFCPNCSRISEVVKDPAASSDGQPPIKHSLPRFVVASEDSCAA